MSDTDEIDEVETLQAWLNSQTYGGDEESAVIDLPEIPEDEFQETSPLVESNEDSDVSPLVESVETETSGGSPIIVTVREELPEIELDFQKWISDLFSQLRTF